MSALITTAYPATLPESGYARAARENRNWFLVKRPSTDEIGITAEPEKGDDVISTYEPESLDQ